MKTTGDKENVLTSSENIPVTQGFRALEALQEASTSAGWDCEYRQLEMGCLESRVRSLQINDLTLIKESANKKLQVCASAPDDFISLLVSVSRQELKINGLLLKNEQMMILQPGTEIHCISQADAVAINIHINDDMFTQYIDKFLPETDPSEIFKNAPVTSSATNIDRMRILLRTAMQNNNPTYSTGEFQDNLLTGLVRIIEASKNDPVDRNRYNRAQKRIILLRAIEYIETNLTISFSVRDLCAYVGISMSTLERFFQRELQLLPGQYLRMRRLNAIRRDIFRLGEHDTISNIAMSYGFMHMGRFSAAYRKQFGSLPSEDIKSAIKK